MGCRFPGGINSPDTFWRLLRNGVDAITDVPEERLALWRSWPSFDPGGVPGFGGFIEEIDAFDAEFFGISPREARHMDPQQRLLLEIAWESMEDAGLIPSEQSGSKTGVFTGIFLDEYWDLQRYVGSGIGINAHTNTGGTTSIAANRISYTFDFHGPSLSVDTACSSSLVAIHLACQSIRSQECDLALAGGVNLILSPQTTEGFASAAMLSNSGRCRPFDAAADGYVRSDGAGLIVLKPLDRALADGDRVYAVIRGSSVNQDGRTSGITVPDVETQSTMLQDACDRAGISPEMVRFVEAHGTGTPVGDPVEAEALGRIIGRNRTPENPCLIGSVKSNFGHTEAAAGVAGMIKAVLALQHRIIPASLHHETPNGKIRFDQIGLHVNTINRAIEMDDLPLVAGVNAFGFGGANAHIILEGIRNPAKSANEMTYSLLPLSAGHPKGVREYGKALAEQMDSSNMSLSDACATAALHRAEHPYRAAVIVGPDTSISEKLIMLGRGETNSGISNNIVNPDVKTVFVFTGMGPQWWGMGRDLYKQESVFLENIHKCDELLKQYADWSLVEEMFEGNDISWMDRSLYAQPANFSLQFALTELWKSRGVWPDSVLGHSVGEIAAAVISGMITLEDGIKIVSLRARLQSELAGKGGMLAVGISPEEGEETIKGLTNLVTIGAVNSPISITLSGDQDVLAQLQVEFESKGVFTRKLNVDVAYHSMQMDGLRTRFLDGLRDISPGSGGIPMISTVTGKVLRSHSTDSEYWWQNMRAPVKLNQAIDHFKGLQRPVFVQIGPHPVLNSAINENIAHVGQSGTVLASLHRDEPEQFVMLKSLGNLFTIGVNIDWKSVLPESYRRVSLPPYPWQRQKFWLEANSIDGPSFVRDVNYPLIDHHLASSSSDKCHYIETILSIAHRPILGEHRVRGRIVISAALYIELAMESIRFIGYQLENVQFENFRILEPCILDEDEQRDCQTVIESINGRISLTINTRLRGKDSVWYRHVVASLLMPPSTSLNPHSNNLDHVDEVIPGDDFYQGLKDKGLLYGSSYRLVGAVRYDESNALAGLNSSKSHEKYTIHPGFIDAGLQVLSSIVSTETLLWLPTGVDRILADRSYDDSGPWSIAVSSINITKGSLSGDINLSASNGKTILALQGVQLEPLHDSPGHVSPAFFKEIWQPSEINEVIDPDFGQTMIFVPDSVDENDSLRLFGDAIIVKRSGSYRKKSAKEYHINPSKPDDYKRLMGEVNEESGITVREIVHMWSLDIPFPDTVDFNGFSLLKTLGLNSLLYLFQSFWDVVEVAPSRLLIVTSGAQHAPGIETVNPLQTSILGLGRVFLKEHPEVQCTLVDIEQTDIQVLAGEIYGDYSDAEIAIRDGNRYLRSTVPVDRASIRNSNETVERVTSSDCSFKTTMKTPGLLDDLSMVRCDPTSPGPGEVEIKIEAAGLNFRDVMTAMGMLPVDTEAAGFGWECAGTVVDVGHGVTSFNSGDPVMAIAPNTIGSHTLTPEMLVARIPRDLTMAEGASIPVIFLTAWYSLIRLARLERGDRILIHSASGGVGLAAIQVARYVGAEVYATAGSEEKRDYLVDLGIQYVLDSRSLEFGDEIRSLTRGEGVDVILNSLAGDAMCKSLEILAPYGRFIELGRTDILHGNQLGLESFDRNMSYFAVDLAQMWKDRPTVVGGHLSEVKALFEDGVFTPPPITEYTIQETVAAFKCMAQAKHKGKIIITLNDDPVEVPAHEVELRSDRSYVVTGAFGGIGGILVDWLQEHGVAHLVLIGRNPPGTRALEIISRLRNDGAEVRAIICDVSRPGELETLFSDIQSSSPPIGGIFHIAGALDDGLIIHQTPERFETVLAPKIEGGWNLHKVSENLDLDFFIFFSSTSSFHGTVGQSNYAAANAFLDGLARFRRSKALPALSINWGGWAEAGMASRSIPGDNDFIDSGIALELLNELLNYDQAQIAVVPERNSAAGERLTVPSDGLIISRDMLRKVPVDEQVECIGLYLQQTTARVIESEPETIALSRPWKSFGIDSLMAVELKNRIERELGVAVPVGSFQSDQSVEELIGYIQDRIF
ncbi:MAG: SDR family NAD(P)-dependent oxidoreductase [Gemmatimonadota bacterium]|nr:SDR family NAD(P)-dependent oxidoreductase [Gemmatimonadota bacterium]